MGTTRQGGWWNEDPLLGQLRTPWQGGGDMGTLHGFSSRLAGSLVKIMSLFYGEVLIVGS